MYTPRMYTPRMIIRDEEDREWREAMTVFFSLLAVVNSTWYNVVLFSTYAPVYVFDMLNHYKITNSPL
jgi:hypothetical protein